MTARFYYNPIAMLSDKVKDERLFRSEKVYREIPRDLYP